MFHPFFPPDALCNRQAVLVSQLSFSDVLVTYASVSSRD